MAITIVGLTSKIPIIAAITKNNTLKEWKYKLDIALC